MVAISGSTPLAVDKKKQEKTMNKHQKNKKG